MLLETDFRAYEYYNAIHGTAAAALFTERLPISTPVFNMPGQQVSMSLDFHVSRFLSRKISTLAHF